MFRITDEHVKKAFSFSQKRFQTLLTVYSLRNIQKIIASELPDSIQKKQDLALTAAKISFFSFHEPGRYYIESKTAVRRRDHNEAHTRFESISEQFLDLYLNDLYSRDRLMQGAIQAGITQDALHASMRAIFLAAAKKVEPLTVAKQESRKPPSSTALHDIRVGELLISHGVNRKHAARIIAKLREKEPSLGAFPEPQKAKLVLDIEKETNAINQRLRDAGM